MTFITYLHLPATLPLLLHPNPPLDGLDEHSMQTVCKATNINRILYAGPAWCGYADKADRTRIGWFVRRLFMAGFTSAALKPNFLLSIHKSFTRNGKHYCHHKPYPDGFSLLSISISPFQLKNSKHHIFHHVMSA